MGRSKLVVAKHELEAVIHKLESENTFTNPSELYIKVSETDWAKGIVNSLGVKKGLNPSSVYQRVKELKIQIKTLKGKRGRVKGFGLTGVRTSRSEKMSNNPEITKALNVLAKSVPQTDNYKARVAKIRAGSMKAAVTLNCQECCCFTREHMLCDVYTCALLPINMLIWPRDKNKIVEETPELEEV